MTQNKTLGPEARGELRDLSLFLDDERVPVTPRAILEGLRRHARSTGETLRSLGGRIALSLAQVRAIVAVERELALCGLAGALRAA